VTTAAFSWAASFPPRTAAHAAAQIGRVLDALAASGQASSTVVAVFSDHGFKLGEFDLWGKHSTLHADLHVPLLVRHPHMGQPGAHTHAVVELIDLFPTIAELAGPATAVRLPRALDGQSLAGMVLENDPLPSGGKEVAVAQYMPFIAKEICMAYSVVGKYFMLKRWTNHRRFARCPPTTLASADLHAIQFAAVAAGLPAASDRVASFIPFALEHAPNLETAERRGPAEAMDNHTAQRAGQLKYQKATAVRAAMLEVRAEQVGASWAKFSV